MKPIKIIIGIIMLLLLMSTAAAIEINNLKTIDDYTKFDNNGYSNYTTNSNRYFLVEKVTFDDDLKNEWFSNHPENEYNIEQSEDNIYYFEDTHFNLYGYQEVVEIDGDNYMVSINQNSKLSPGEKTLYLEDLKEFNKLNNLEALEI